MKLQLSQMLQRNDIENLKCLWEISSGQGKIPKGSEGVNLGEKTRRAFLAEETFVYRGPMAGGATASMKDWKRQWDWVWGGGRGARSRQRKQALHGVGGCPLCSSGSWVGVVSRGLHINSDCWETLGTTLSAYQLCVSASSWALI